MPRWSPVDIDWTEFRPDKLDQDILRVIKAASLTEHNAADYTRYLLNVFEGDADFAAAVLEWQAEEEQHGRMLGRYSELADPDFDFNRAFSAFRDGYSIQTTATASVRGSRTGELLARCIVETGTSSFYSAIAEATDEPVLKSLARRIAGDEFRHYGMFRHAMTRYQGRERLGLWRRTAVALGRIRELDDDELSFAYHCANDPDGVYDRSRANADYSTRAYRLYRRHHADKAVAMIMKATGYDAQGWLGRQVANIAWRRMKAIGEGASA